MDVFDELSHLLQFFFTLKKIHNIFEITNLLVWIQDIHQNHVHTFLS